MLPPLLSFVFQVRENDPLLQRALDTIARNGVEWPDGLAPNRQEMQLELEYRDDLPNRRGYEGHIAYSRGASYRSRKSSRHGLVGPNAHTRGGRSILGV